MPQMIADLLASAPIPAQTVDAAVRGGLPAEAVGDLVEDGWLGWEDAYALIAPRRTLQRRLADHAALTPDESDRLTRLIGLFAHARRVFGDEGKAKRWLARPWAAWDGRTRLDVASTSAGIEAVHQALGQIEWGMFA